MDYKSKEKVENKSARYVLCQQHPLTSAPTLPNPSRVDTYLMRQTYRVSN